MAMNSHLDQAAATTPGLVASASKLMKAKKAKGAKRPG
jgi:hypothetical protein